ncbi:MAG: Ig-like domain-containing protein [Chloroflexi bacterium]|nr:Ig-like domain-containing protein [Chloroflexota bacterium]
MNRFSLRAFGAVLIVAAYLLAGVAPASAVEPVTLQTEATKEVRLGDTVTVRVTARDGQGRPVAKATILMFSPAQFGAASGEMKLGQVSTDASGQATFTFQARRQGPQTIVARFSGNGKYSTAENSVALTVSGSGHLYEQKAGVEIPGLGVWVLIMLLGGFWSAYLFVMALLTRIARKGEQPLRSLGGGHGRE